MEKYREENLCNEFINFKRANEFVVNDKFIFKPNRNNNYCTQGCCSFLDNILISSYDSGYYEMGIKSKKQKPILDIISDTGMISTIKLNSASHVGGIACHPKSEKIFICGNNGIDIYNSDLSVYATYEFDGNDKLSKSSYITINDDFIYIGEFNATNNTILCKYLLKNNGVVGNHPISTYIVPFNQVQGMCIYKYNKKEYYFFSRSYGRRNDSKLTIAILNENNEFTELDTFKLPCMAEQISIDGDGYLMIVFESDCLKYSDGYDKKGKSSIKIDKVCYLDPKKIILNILKKL